MYSAIIDAGTVNGVSLDLREPTTSSRSVHGVKLAVLSPYDRKDVLKVASCRDSLVQLNLGRRGPVTGALIDVRGWAKPLPDLASCTRERSPIVFRGLTGPIAALLITPWGLAAPTVTLVRAGTRIGGPAR